MMATIKTETKGDTNNNYYIKGMKCSLCQLLQHSVLDHIEFPIMVLDGKYSWIPLVAENDRKITS